MEFNLKKSIRSACAFFALALAAAWCAGCASSSGAASSSPKQSYLAGAETGENDGQIRKAASVRIWKDHLTASRLKVTLTVYLPAAENANGSAAIILPGGSYYHMGIFTEGFEVAKFLAQHGTAGFVLDYRTALTGNHHPAMIQDVQRAIQLVKENAQTYGISPEKVGVLGFSAGGHLSGTAAEYFDTNFLAELGIETETSLRPAFCGMIYPVVTMQEPYAHKKSRKNLLGKSQDDEAQRQLMSLEKNVRVDMPPVFLVQCTGDKTVDFHNAVLLEQALTEKKVKHKFLLFEEDGHGFGSSEKKYPRNKAWTWRADFIEWLKEIGVTN